MMCSLELFFNALPESSVPYIAMLIEPLMRPVNIFRMKQCLKSFLFCRDA